MTKRRKSKQSSVSLFPFLSILACVIGVLTLMIAGMAVTQLEEEPDVAAIEAAEERKEELEKAKREIKDNEVKLEELRKLYAQAIALQEKLKLAKEEIEKLKKQKDDQGKKMAEREKLKELELQLLAEKRRLELRIAELEPDLATLEEELKKLREELAKRKEPPPEAVVKVQPGGSGYDLTPTFVECRSNGVMLYDKPEPHFVRTGDMTKDERFAALLDHVADGEKRTVIFLVRANAIGVYYQARNVARSRSARNGKLAVVGQGTLDLSLFKKLFKGS